jgi:hypothetical protein
MPDRHARFLVVALAGLMAVFATPAAPRAQAPPAAKNPLAKLTQLWPDAAQLRQRKARAESLRLFAAADPLALTVVGDLKAVNRDRDPRSTKRYPAELRVAREDGRIDRIPVLLGARGHVRRMRQTCDFVPLRVELPADGLKGTLFEGQDVLKLVVQCSNGGEFEQYLLREYLAYRLFNLMSPRGFRARLAHVTYVDSASGKSIGDRYGMFLEDDSDVARRMEGRTVDLPRALFRDLDQETLGTMMVFEYMIGNTDLSIYALHNVVLVQTPDRALFPVPYDFDISGLVHPPYAIPDRKLSIKTVFERLYRGPCRTVEQIQPVLSNFIARKDLVMAAPDAIADMARASRQEAKAYLEGFYSAIKNDRDVRRTFVEGCSKAPAM